jgi:hypothetical protein
MLEEKSAEPHEAAQAISMLEGLNSIAGNLSLKLNTCEKALFQDIYQEKEKSKNTNFVLGVRIKRA